MRPDELAFVASTWKRSARQAPPNQHVRTSTFFDEINQDVERVLSAGPIVLVSRNPNNPREAYGWLCMLVTPSEAALVYCYTKFETRTKVSLRRRGIMRGLLSEALKLVPELPCVYCADSRFNPVFDRYGLEYVELADVLADVEKAA